MPSRQELKPRTPCCSCTKELLQGSSTAALLKTANGCVGGDHLGYTSPSPISGQTLVHYTAD